MRCTYDWFTMQVAADGRLPTPFQAYLRSKRVDEGSGPGLQDAKALQEAGQGIAAQAGAVDTSSAALKQAAAAWLKGQQIPPKKSQSVSQHHARPSQMTELAEAAVSLAEAAKVLAGTGGVSKVQASYSALAAAAHDLALNVTAHSLGSSSRESHQPTPLEEKPQPVSQALTSTGHAHTHALPAPFSMASGQPVVERGRTSTPRFTPLNPLLAIAAGEAPRTRPSSTAVQVGRPFTANPITHSLQDSTACPASSGSTGAAHLLRSSTPNPPGPGDKGCGVAQVLTLEAGAAAQLPAPAINQDSGELLDPLALFIQHPEMVRMSKWPPSTPLTQGAFDADKVARAVNTVLASLRERIHTHGAPSVVRCFKRCDNDNSGGLDIHEFRAVLDGLNLVNVDNQEAVLDLVMQGLDKDKDGRINYLEFCNAVKFNKLPYKEYDRRFRHRTAGNPEQPCGPSGVRFPYGTLPDAETNSTLLQTRVDDTFLELRRAFRGADEDADGIVNRTQFSAALQALDAKNRLGLSDAYIQTLFRDADPDFSGGVDYHKFVSAFESGTPGSRFVPEFLLPRSLRCSQLGPPWEWHTSPIPGARRAGAMAPPLSATRNVGAGLGPLAGGVSGKPIGKRTFPAHAEGPPATPLVLPGTRLLRSLHS